MKNIHQLQKDSYKRTVVDFENEINRIRHYADSLDTYLADMKIWTEYQILAFDLHAKFGKMDESWGYEITDGIHNWYGSDHTKWLTKATQLLQFSKEQNIDLENLAAIADIIGRR